MKKIKKFYCCAVKEGYLGFLRMTPHEKFQQQKINEPDDNNDSPNYRPLSL